MPVFVYVCDNATFIVFSLVSNEATDSFTSKYLNKKLNLDLVLA